MVIAATHKQVMAQGDSPPVKHLDANRRSRRRETNRLSAQRYAPLRLDGNKRQAH